MRIPKTILVKGKRWKIFYKWNLMDDDGCKCDGLCEYKARVIWLDRSLLKSEKVQTFLHELVHALIYELHLNTSLPGEVEEVLAEGISQYFLEIFNMRLKR